jgi:hypothetical protein
MAVPLEGVQRPHAQVTDEIKPVPCGAVPERVMGDKEVVMG